MFCVPVAAPADPSCLKVGVKIAMFSLPGCPHCVKFLPVFKEVLQKYAGRITAEFVLINCKENLQECLAQGVKGVPAVHLYQNGTFIDHLTDLSYEEFCKFIDRFTGVGQVIQEIAADDIDMHPSLAALEGSMLSVSEERLINLTDADFAEVIFQSS